MTWYDVPFEVITPLFTARGDSIADSLRPTDVKARLRHWLRALSGSMIGDDLALLRRLEADVYGSAATSDSGGPSKVRVRVRGQMPLSHDLEVPWVDEKVGIPYLLGQGLYKAANRGRNERAALLRPYVAPGSTGCLRIDPGPFPALVAASLWAMSAAGGFGAHTSRGWGALRFDPSAIGDISPEVAALVTSGAAGVDAFSLDHLGTMIAAARNDLLRLLSTDHTPPDQSASSYPNTGRMYSQTFDYGASYRWHEVLESFGSHMAERRRMPDDPRHTIDFIDSIVPAVADRVPGTPFPRGGFGLPVEYRSKSLGYVTVRVGSTPAEQRLFGRRASPLHIRPMRTGDGRWLVSLIAWHGQFLPAGVSVVAHAGTGTYPLVASDGVIAKRLDEWV